MLLPQYAAMFVSAGEPGNAKKVQVSVAAARKVFRVFGVRTAIFKASCLPKEAVRALSQLVQLQCVTGAFCCAAAPGAAHAACAQPAPQPQQAARGRGYKQGVARARTSTCCTQLRCCLHIAQRSLLACDCSVLWTAASLEQRCSQCVCSCIHGGLCLPTR